MFLHRDVRRERLDEKRYESLQNYRRKKAKALEESENLKRREERWIESLKDRQEQAARWDHQDKIVQRSYRNLDTTEVRLINDLPRNKIWLAKKIKREYDAEAASISQQG